MVRVKIKQLGDATATAGLHFGLGPSCRKLEPGEVVELPQDVYDAMRHDVLEITDEDVTRPLVFASEQEAKLSSPSFKPRGPDDEREREAVLNAVVSRLATEDSPPTAPTAAPPAARRRAARRAASEQGTST